jgi:hypothetical protein
MDAGIVPAKLDTLSADCGFDYGIPARIQNGPEKMDIAGLVFEDQNGPH